MVLNRGVFICYLITTSDEMETPLAYCETMTEVSKYMGRSADSLYSSLARSNNHEHIFNNGYKVIRVILPKEEIYGESD